MYAVFRQCNAMQTCKHASVCLSLQSDLYLTFFPFPSLKMCHKPKLEPGKVFNCVARPASICSATALLTSAGELYLPVPERIFEYIACVGVLL